MRRYDFYSDWEKYAYPSGSETAADEDIKEKYDSADLTADKFTSSGIPLLKDGSRVFFNGLSENTTIFGETGCKKTRSVIEPLIVMTAGAGESAVVTDVKGEISANRQLRRYLDEKGVRTVCIDFRSFDKDCYSILEHPFMLYRSGQKRKALSEVTRLLSAMTSKYERDNEPVWHEQAESCLSALIELIFIAAIESRCPEYVNMLTLAGFANMGAIRGLTEIAEEYGDFCKRLMTPENYAALNNIINNPADKMVGSITGFVHSMIKPFAADPSLSEMLSHSSFDIEDLYSRPTCVFLVIPDETSAYDAVSGLLIDNFYSRLIETYGKKFMEKSEPPCRVNFICDEFCNLHINDMRSKISASRSRCMRWYLVCQSKAQLEAAYRDEASTIIGNCRNMLFLQSCDKDLVNYFCDLCGETYVTESGNPDRLISPDVLRGLRKEREFKEALFIEGTTVYFAELPDIDSYEILDAYAQKRAAIRPRRGKKPADIEVLDLSTLVYIMKKWREGKCQHLYDCEEYEDEEEEDPPEELICDDDYFKDLLLDPDLLYDDPDETLPKNISDADRPSA